MPKVSVEQRQRVADAYTHFSNAFDLAAQSDQPAFFTALRSATDELMRALAGVLIDLSKPEPPARC